MPPLFQRIWLTAILILVLLWLGRGVMRLQQQRQGVVDQLHDVESKVAGMARDNAFLASASAYFSSGTYLDRQARLKLNYKLADEQVAFVYKDTSVKQVPPDQALSARIAAMANWRKWVYWLFHH